jgi:ABC-2 type transport system ATP-binding protein
VTRRILALLLLAAVAAPPGLSSAAPSACVESPRPPSNPVFSAQEQAFGFHDEEIVICSDGWTSPVHVAARLWVPKGCPGAGGCAGVVMAHGFGFNKEVTFADMYTAVGLGMYVLSYDVRGQGMSGGQAAFLGRDDIADQAEVLRWWHANVKPVKTAFYGLSQGGYLSWTAAIYNCGAARAASYDSTIPCGDGGRWIDAIAPIQGPTEMVFNDGTCPVFGIEAIAYSRFNPALLSGLLPCITTGRPEPVEGIFVDVAHRLDRIDVPVYAVTSFYDRLIPPQQVTTAYQALRARTLDPGDELYGKDLRLTISNDGHGAVGGNFAVVGDVFAWIHHELALGPALRDAKVAIAQEWEGNAFRLEQEWPIPGTAVQTYLLGDDALSTQSGTGEPELLRNLPLPSGPPEAPFVGTVIPANNDNEVPGSRIVYSSAPLTQTMEVTGLPSARIYVSSANPDGEGSGQLHLGLAELEPDGSAHEFSHGRIGLTGLGPTPVAVDIPMSVSSHRVDAGNRLMLSITSSDVFVIFPDHGSDDYFVHHDAGAPSSIFVPVVPVDRVPPAGSPPSGAGFTEDPLGAICQALHLPC